MNGASVSGTTPVKLKIYNDTEEGEGMAPQYVSAKDAKVEVINPAEVKAKVENVKNVVRETIDKNYLQPINKIDMDESGKRNEDKALVLDNTDATQALGKLYSEASKVPKMLCDAVDPFYDEAVSVCNKYQSQFNQEAWTIAGQIRNSMGPGAKIIEIYGGGSN